MRPISNTVEILVSGLDAASLSLLASNFGLKRRTGRRWAKDGISFPASFGCSFLSSSLLLASITCIIFSLVENISKRRESHFFAALGGSSAVTAATMSLNNTFSSFFASPPSCSVTLAVSFLGSDSVNIGGSSSTTMCFLSRDQPLSLDFIMPFGFWITLRRGSAAGKESFLSSFFSVNGVVGADTTFSGLASWLFFGLAGNKRFSGDAVFASGEELVGFVPTGLASGVALVGILGSVDSFNSFCCTTLALATGDSVIEKGGIVLRWVSGVGVLGFG
nr:uncharacterized protein LOC115120352 [Oncorhynchus nerka]